MDEAKTLVHHALTAMFAVLTLGAVMALLTLGNLMWRAFADQADANRRLNEYAKFSAFDGTEVRGQDVIALLHNTQGTPFIIIADSSGAPINVIFNNAECYFKLSDAISNAGVNTTVDSILAPFSAYTVDSLACLLTERTETFENTNYIGRLEPGTNKGAAINMSADITFTYSEIQEWFLGRGEIVSGGTAGYLAYDSYLLYENDGTSDIIGIVCVEKAVSGG